MKDRIGKALQVIGIIGLIVGIVVEVVMRAEVGYIVLTVSAWLFAIGTKLTQIMHDISDSLIRTNIVGTGL